VDKRQERWIAHDGSIYTETAHEVRLKSGVRQVQQAIAFNLDQEHGLAEHVVKLHNASLPQRGDRFYDTLAFKHPTKYREWKGQIPKWELGTLADLINSVRSTTRPTFDRFGNEGPPTEALGFIGTSLLRDEDLLSVTIRFHCNLADVFKVNELVKNHGLPLERDLAVDNEHLDPKYLSYLKV
jgi:hypothetical protein